MKRSAVWLLLCVVVLGVTGCETMKGMGKDIENTGQNIQEQVHKRTQ